MLTRTTEDQRQLLPMFTIIICTTLESETVGSFYRHLCEAGTYMYVCICSSIHMLCAWIVCSSVNFRGLSHWLKLLPLKKLRSELILAR